MTEYQPPPPPVPPPPASPRSQDQAPPRTPAPPRQGVAAPAPALQRREDRKVVAGVCSGLAYRLGIDPNVVRIVTIVLALFGGAGVLLYALGWLLLPEERTGRSLGERAVRGGTPDRAGAVLLGAVLTLVAVGFGFAVVGDNWFGVTVLVVAVAIGALLLTRQPNPAQTAPTPPAPPVGAPQPAPAYPGAGLGFGSQQAYWGLGAADRPSIPFSPPAPLDAPAAMHPEPVASRPRSVLGPLTVFAAVAALGVLGVLAAIGADLPVSAYLAAPLAVVGAGLVVGAWLGRSRGLIGLGLALTVLLVPVATIEQLGVTGSAGDAFEPVVRTATQPAEVDGVILDYAAADVRWDMSGVDFDGTTADARANVGAGALVVDLPPDVTLVLDATVGAGEIDALGDTSGGLGVSARRTFEGADSGGTLNLQVQMGLGTVEVNREQA